jgi:hypothetical protein
MNNKLIFNLDNNSILCAHNAIEKWVKSKELSLLIKAFNSSIPNDLDLKNTVDWLLTFSNIWDYRNAQTAVQDKVTGEKARWLITDEDLNNEQRKCVFSVISKLGLVDNTMPSKKYYDYVIVLGGAKMSCLLRPQYASKLINEKIITTSHVILLGTERPISESEREATDSYAKNAKTEFDLVDAGAKSSFNLKTINKINNENESNINLGYRIYGYKDVDKNLPVIAISAPSKEPNTRRANTADTYDFFLSQYNIPPKSSFLVITSQIYVPYQELEALRTVSIPYDINIETIGFINDDNLKDFNAAKYLQEIRSTIQSIARFIEKYTIEDNSNNY